MKQQTFQWNFDNRRLFSDHYLETRIPESDRWKNCTPDEVFERLIDRWKKTDLEGANEAQTERRWIRPVLEELGHSYCVQTSLETPYSTRQPDYFFFDQNSPSNLEEPVDEPTLAKFGAFAVGDAKRWGRNLDETADAEVDPNENPSLQIDFYIRHSGLDWGILTNGKQWRLYHRNSSRKLEIFYQVDLPQVLQQGQLEAFKYFWLFFHRTSFLGDPCWLDRVLKESEAYQQGVGDDLEHQVYDALKALAQGFIDYPDNELDPRDPETLQKIHDSSLIVLYRILFTLYAESRELLPMYKSSGFATEYNQDYSFSEIKRTVKNKFEASENEEVGAPTRANIWSKLQNLWDIISEGDEYLGVPVYNGGLFDPDRHPFLEKHVVGDRDLRKAIDLLARAEDPHTNKHEFVDYRDLDVRNLGSIYEGLLEYKIRYADKPLATERENGREMHVQVDSTEEADVEPGDVYLETDKGERKATGSYYTPDYIVEHIVENTVGPLLRDLREAHSNSEGEVVERRALVRKILALDILDPAMGSGHFLVEATDYIARELVDIAGDFAELNEHETELSYWQRRVAQSCIYGVDINPLAVELAKLSLWLKTAAYDKPLSFLDHHLRCGNSLIGAEVDELPLRRDMQASPDDTSQMSLLDDSVFAGSMANATKWIEDIEELKGETLADIKKAEELYQRTVDEVTETPRLLADVYTAQHFGLELEEKYFAEMAKRVLHGTFESVPEYQKIRQQAEGIGGANRFFHWELEFPEVFFDENGNHLGEEAGFNAVIGNPPYSFGRDWGELPEKPYLSRTYRCAEYQIDLYHLFMEAGLNLAKLHGYVSFIVPDVWTQAVYSEGLRELYLDSLQLNNISSLPSGVFEDATVDTITFSGLKKKAVHESEIEIYEMEEAQEGERRFEYRYSIEQGEFRKNNSSKIDFWSRPSIRSITSKIEEVSLRLGEICETTRGINAYDRYQGQSKETIENRAYHADHEVDESFSPLMMGKNTARYVNKWDGDHWIKYGEWLAAPREERMFSQPKLLTRKILSNGRIVCLVDEEGFYVDQQLYIGVNPCEGFSLHYICAIVNSSLTTFHYLQSNREEGVEFPQITVKAHNDLCIRDIKFDTPEAERDRFVDELLTKIEEVKSGSADALDEDILTVVEDHLEARPSREDVVHDLLAVLAREMKNLRTQRSYYDVDILAYIGPRVDGPAIPDMGVYQPNANTGPLSKTTDEINKLRVGQVCVERDRSDTVTVKATARYKPEDKKECCTDRWGYTETEFFEVFQLANLDERQAVLIEAFVPAAVEKGDGFAGFRDNATTNISLVDRIEDLKLPKLSRVEEDLRRFCEAKAEAKELDEQIEFTDRLIDQLVYRLYGLTANEITTIQKDVEFDTKQP